MILDCDQLLTLIAPCRWAIAIENTIRDIIDSAHAYLADHFASLLASDAFLSLGQGHSWNISRLEHLLLRTATQLTPEQACRSYQRVTRLNAVLHASAASSGSQTTTLMGDRVDLLVLPGGSGGGRGGGGEEIEWNAEFLRLVDDVLNAVQHCLTNQCGRAMRTGQWQRMNADLRLNIQKLACLAEPPDRRASQMTKVLDLQYNLNIPNSSVLIQFKSSQWYTSRCPRAAYPMHFCPPAAPIAIMTCTPSNWPFRPRPNGRRSRCAHV